MSFSWMPSDLATKALPEPGFWLGTHISNLPSFQWAMVFMGSSVAWARKGKV